MGNWKFHSQNIQPKQPISVPVNFKREGGLKVPKPKILFTEYHKLYLQENFNEGKITGRKEDPSKVAEDFSASFFSRLVQKEKKLDEEDLEFVNVDIKCEKLKQDILEKCTL